MYEHPNGSPMAFIILEGRQNVHDDERSGRPVTATDNAAAAAVRNVVEADRRVTIDETMIQLPPGIEIGRSSIGAIIERKYLSLLKYKKNKYSDSVQAALSNVRDSAEFWKIIASFKKRNSTKGNIDIPEW
ncbi:hypothetical protein LAZ67_3004638 [Cordylochernes scorpioides]|uniref:Uncharacterized protein n=1 Tax=Cordylochernes scorpioides TaxID=51811 RepID=A0ABY6KD01_9ARAC|nr:hypothetical protein LAZ67_3004638 [Cordylochernes scorpioides]